MSVDLRSHFPTGFTPRPEQARLLAKLADALAEIEDDRRAPRVLLIEAPPGVGKSHLAITLARWSGDAYLLTSQKMLQDQYEREFAGDLALVKGRDNYSCERYPAAVVPTSRGACRRPRGPACGCPYVRAKQIAMNAPVFCTNTAYFATLRHWHAEQLRRRKLLVIDEAHNLESQLVSVFTARFSHDEMREWFGRPLPRLAHADEYRPVLAEYVERLESRRAEIARALDAARPPALPEEVVLESPLTREEHDLLEQRDQLDAALARLTFFLDAEDREWVVRYPAEPAAALALVPLTVAAMAQNLLSECAEVTVLSSAYLGHREVLAECFGLDAGGVRVFTIGSPFSLEQRPIEYRPVGALSRATREKLEPALFSEVAAILAAHPDDKGLIHVPSYDMGRRLVADLGARAPRESRRLLWIDSASGKSPALEHHRASPLPTVLVSPSLREGVDLPDDFLRFQVLTKLPYPDLGDPWTAARQSRDHRWYATETAKALLQTYGRSCRHAGDHGVTYVLDAQFARFLQRYRVLLPEWFLDAAEPAVRHLAGGELC
jgi:ATP-dependent DNA helicase DinG